MNHQFLFIFCSCIVLQFSSSYAAGGGYPCCDALNPSAQNADCSCSDQTGGIGTCSCKTSPNTRQGWLCKKDAYGDSVNITVVLFS